MPSISNQVQFIRKKKQFLGVKSQNKEEQKFLDIFSHKTHFLD